MKRNWLLDDIFDGIATKLDVRQFRPQDVLSEIKQSILEAARLMGSGINTQHWWFIVVECKDQLKKLAEDSTSRQWVAEANFAIIVLTNPKHKFHMIDAGRCCRTTQLAAWNRGVALGLFADIKEDKLRNDFGIPKELNIAVVIGFGLSCRQVDRQEKGSRAAWRAGPLWKIR
ncbi:putative nitroreductase [Candidatus Nitrososphaera gargensis Ga9.2]|uniref:Putative nitroreductase n=1 Tax=Nitrososphaera gargensis (strain Ga9.2) TaxID=1237085 RepID=K0IDH5_NITGG|nr:nitroreductase family protein [Candidatus Nitrososphaera gargensis]AFU59456.1 putative nitroreductase [Candidatus Nitrososphaera gargensis Ga9.2]